MLCDAVLEPPPGGELRAPAAGIVKTIDRREGEAVRAGEPILRLDSADLVGRALAARSLASELAAQRESAEAEVRQLGKDLEYRREVLESDDRLLASGALVRSSRDADELAVRQAEEKLASARSRLRSLAGAGKGSGASRAELAEQAARDLERRLASLTVRSPRDGRVYGLPRREGETVAEGQPVASVIDPLRRRVRAHVDPPDLPRLRAGQPLTVTFDGLPDRRWEGAVQSVDPTIRPVAGRDVAEVVGEVPDPEALLPVNASVNVQIIVGRKEAALAVPRSALYRDGDRRFVYVPLHGRAVRRDISLGLLGLSEAEALTGLQAGERVLLPGPVPLADGLAVRLRD